MDVSFQNKQNQHQIKGKKSHYLQGWRAREELTRWRLEGTFREEGVL